MKNSARHRIDQQQRDDDDGDNEPLVTSRLLELFQRQNVRPLLHQSVLSPTFTYWFFRWGFRSVSYWRQRQIKKNLDQQHLHQYEELQLLDDVNLLLPERWHIEPLPTMSTPRRGTSRELQLLQQNSPSFKYWKCSLLHMDIPDHDLTNTRLHTEMGQAFGQNTRLGKLILDPFLAVEDPMARSVFATGICCSKIHSLKIRCSNQPNRTQHQDNRHLAEMVSIILIDNKSLTRLELSAAVLGQDDMTTLSEGLCHNSYLTNLVFTECDICDRGLGILFRQGLQTNTSLRQLTVESCRVDDAGIKGLVEHWHPKSPIQSLRLPNNNIGPIGAQLLFRAAQRHPALQTLDISANGNVGIEAVRNIGKDLPNQHYLTSISLFHCIDSRPLDLKLPLAAYRALLDGLYSNLHILEFNVYGNGFPLGREDEIHFYLWRNMSGGNLLLSNRVSASLWCYFFQKCQFHDLGASLLFFYLRKQPSLFAVPQSSHTGTRESNACF